MVCVVDDDDSLLRALRRLLDATGFRVETFSSAEQFLESEHRGRADCLVLDVHLGGLSGLDLQERLADVGGEHADRHHHGPRRAVHARARPAGRRDRVPAEALRRRLAHRRHPQGDRPLLTPCREAHRGGDPGISCSLPASPGAGRAGRARLAGAPWRWRSCSPAAASCRRASSRTSAARPSRPPIRPRSRSSGPSRAVRTSGSGRSSRSPRAIRPPPSTSRPCARAAPRWAPTPSWSSTTGCRSSGPWSPGRGGRPRPPDRRARGGRPRDPLLGPLTRAAGAPSRLTREGQGLHERPVGRRRRAEPVHGPRRRAPRLAGRRRSAEPLPSRRPPALRHPLVRQHGAPRAPPPRGGLDRRQPGRGHPGLDAPGTPARAPGPCRARPAGPVADAPTSWSASGGRSGSTSSPTPATTAT